MQARIHPASEGTPFTLGSTCPRKRGHGTLYSGYTLCLGEFHSEAKDWLISADEVDLFRTIGDISDNPRL